MAVLVVNVGSSSLKLSVLDADDQTLASESLARGGEPLPDRGLSAFVGAHREVDAVGHRIVHGGTAFTAPVLLDDDVVRAIHQLDALAPLHNPPALHAVETLRQLRPDLPQVACFDTAFHAALPPRASTYAVPRRWREEFSVRKFGFHCLSHAWAARRAAELLDVPEGLRVVTAHLGAGASLAAVVSGRSVDTTMGMTPLDGLVMSTRAGSIDAGVIFQMMRRAALSAEAVESALASESGLLGLSERSGDLRDVLAAMDGGDERATLAYEVYAYRIQTGIATMATAMGGLDALSFSGGAGEASARLREDVCDGLAFLGIGPLRPAAELGGVDAVASAGGAVAVLVVHAREDVEVARQVRAVLRERGLP